MEGGGCFVALLRCMSEVRSRYPDASLHLHGHVNVAGEESRDITLAVIGFSTIDEQTIISATYY